MSEKDKSWRIAYINGKFALWKETDFWRMGVMKRMPVLLSLSIVMIFGIFLTIYFR
tara:strand:- start:432 stop:599 length:168 start_codon:yes stop_codon:yes gene_type:complete